MFCHLATLQQMSGETDAINIKIFNGGRTRKKINPAPGNIFQLFYETFCNVSHRIGRITSFWRHQNLTYNLGSQRITHFTYNFCCPCNQSYLKGPLHWRFLLMLLCHSDLAVQFCGAISRCNFAVQFCSAMTRPHADYSIVRTKTRAETTSGNSP
jgi:hypothetical protein